MRKLKSTLAVLAMLLLIGGAVAPAAFAQEEPYIPEKKTYFLTSEPISSNWSLPGVKAEKHVTKLKSSNKNVISVEKFSYNGTVYVGATPRKAGKSTISFTAKVNGKNKTYKCAATVKKYTLPFESFKIGSANMAKKLTKTNRVDIKLGKTLKSQKVSFKLKKGWSLNWAGYYNSSNGQSYKAVKSGSKITLKKGKQLQISLTYKNDAILDLFVSYE